MDARLQAEVAPPVRAPAPSDLGGDTTGIDFDNIYYYIKPTDTLANDWDMVPESIKNTYERLGIPRPSASTWPA